jgi:glycosyltransferase involved in cell wall biosynthesis
VIRVLALVPHPPSGASTRYRVLQFMPALAASGIELHPAFLLDEDSFARLYRPGGHVAKALDLTRGYLRRARQVRTASEYDAVLIHREVWPLRGQALERGLLRHNPRWLFDLDDAVWLPNVSRANRGFALLKDAAKSAWIVRHARAVSAGNADLLAWAEREMSPRPGARLVPTALDVRRWRSARPAAGEAGAAGEASGAGRGIVLGWIGSHSTVGYLEGIAPALVELSRRHPDLSLRVIGAEANLPGVRVTNVPWTYADEVAQLDAVDIGLGPMPDDPWTRGKCGLKLLQYAALGKPIVCSPVGANRAIVEAGREGFYADGVTAWVDAVEQLIADPARREAMAVAGRRTVVERYSIEAVAPALGAAVRTAAGAN